MPFKPDIAARLNSEIDPELVSTRSQSGSTFIYLEGFTVIDQANDIFGFDGWDSNVESLESIEVGDKTCYKAIVRVTVLVPAKEEDQFDRAVTRQDVGFAIVQNKRDGSPNPDGHEVAIKGAVTDAMKRAFRTFGNQFGNSLYDKDSAANESMKNPRRAAPRPAAARPSVKSTEAPLPCEADGCDSKIVATDSKRENRVLQPSEVAERSRTNFGKALCRDHMVKAQEAKSAAK